jgi:hypothetical protein
MSFQTWHNYGYGICVDGISDVTVEKLQSLLHLAPQLENEIHEWLSECEITDPTYEDYLEFDQDFHLGLATLLSKTVKEVEDIDLTACDDFKGKTFLIYMPRYPWHMCKTDYFVTEESLQSLFGRYVSLLTDKPINIEYQEIENGG